MQRGHLLPDRLGAALDVPWRSALLPLAAQTPGCRCVAPAQRRGPALQSPAPRGQPRRWAAWRSPQARGPLLLRWRRGLHAAPKLTPLRPLLTGPLQLRSRRVGRVAHKGPARPLTTAAAAERGPHSGTESRFSPAAPSATSTSISACRCACSGGRDTARHHHRKLSPRGATWPATGPAVGASHAHCQSRCSPTMPFASMLSRASSSWRSGRASASIRTVLVHTCVTRRAAGRIVAALGDPARILALCARWSERQVLVQGRSRAGAPCLRLCATAAAACSSHLGSLGLLRGARARTSFSRRTPTRCLRPRAAQCARSHELGALAAAAAAR